MINLKGDHVFHFQPFPLLVSSCLFYFVLLLLLLLLLFLGGGWVYFFFDAKPSKHNWMISCEAETKKI